MSSFPGPPLFSRGPWFLTIHNCNTNLGLGSSVTLARNKKASTFPVKEEGGPCCCVSACGWLENACP